MTVDGNQRAIKMLRRRHLSMLVNIVMMWKVSSVLRLGTTEKTSLTPRPEGSEMKYWYQIYVDFCPACLSEDRWRERVYKKPKGSIWHEVYDGCVL